MQCLQRNQVDAASIGHHKLQAIQAVDSFAPLSCFLAGFERLIVRRSNRRQDHERAKDSEVSIPLNGGKKHGRHFSVKNSRNCRGPAQYAIRNRSWLGKLSLECENREEWQHPHKTRSAFTFPSPSAAPNAPTATLPPASTQPAITPATLAVSAKTWPMLPPGPRRCRSICHMR